MNRSLTLLAVAGLALAATADDTLYMDNGDRITGRIEQMQGDVLLFTTSYAGTVSVQWSSIVRLESDEPVVLELNEGTNVEGLLKSEGDVQGIEADGDWRELDLAGVTLVARDAQTIETLEAAEAPPSPWSGSATAGLTLRSGNTDTLDVSAAIEAKREAERNTLTLGLTGAYGKAEDVLNTRRHALNAKWQYYPRERLYLFGQGLEEQDDGRKLDLRVRLTTGLGYDFMESERMKLSGDLGLSHTWEEWAGYTPAERDAARNGIRAAGTANLRSLAMGLADGSVNADLQAARDVLRAIFDIRSPLRDEETRDEQFMNLQLGLYFERKLFEHSTFTGTLVAHPSLEDMGEVQLTSNIAFLTPLRERLDLRIALESAYDSTADESDVDAWDHTLTTGLRYAF